MSAFQFPANGAQLHAQVISSSTVTTIFDGTDEGFNVPWFMVSEHAGSTPNLTVELYDGTTSYYLGDSGSSPATWNAKAVTAKQTVIFREGYVIAKGWKLRVTSSDAAGKFHVIGTQSSGY